MIDNYDYLDDHEIMSMVMIMCLWWWLRWSYSHHDDYDQNDHDCHHSDFDKFIPSRPPYYNNKPKREGKDPANMSNYETNPVGALQVTYDDGENNGDDDGEWRWRWLHK